jgi:hypothetical protein
VPEYPNPAFLNMDTEDAFWAAKQVMAFTDEDIRKIVATGEYTDPAASDWVERCLIERRNKIGRAFFSRVLPFDRFAVRNHQLVYDDLGAIFFGTPMHASVQWHTFDNASGNMERIDGANSFAVPQVTAEFLAADIRAAGRSLRVYLRATPNGNTREVVGREVAQPELRLLTRR